jgi:hypothetical protein
MKDTALVDNVRTFDRPASFDKMVAVHVPVPELDIYWILSAKADEDRFCTEPVTDDEEQI